MNPLYNMLMGGGAHQMPNNPMNNMMGFIQSFNNFRQTFQGNPQQQIQSMLQSGQISQERYNQAVQMANQIQQFMNGGRM